MPKIIQFTHPGSEHRPDKRNGNHKSWNTKNHKRKFLLSKGTFVSKGTLYDGNLVFWGEWEPPSHVEKLVNKPTKFHPQWLHSPYLPEELPIPDKDNQYQNTDPCVFGNEFKYFVCKQFKPKLQKTTSLAKLEKGSIILFGSTGNQNKEDAFFQLDTVFVVGDYIDYDPSNPNALKDSNLGIYRDFVFKMAFPNAIDHSLPMRLYIGATFENQIEGMYSFTPAKIWENQDEGFPRIGLKDMEYISNNINAAPKISEAPITDVVNIWNKIREITREKGCVEAVKLTI